MCLQKVRDSNQAPFFFLDTLEALPKQLNYHSLIRQQTMDRLNELWKSTFLDQIEQPKQIPNFNLEKEIIDTNFNPLNSHEKRIREFCHELIKQMEDGLKTNQSKVESIQTIKKQIAQIIFLAEKNPETTALFLSDKNISNSLKQVEIEFQKTLDQIIQNINFLKAAHDRVPFQNSSLVEKNQKILAIASILLSSSGLLNFGLIGVVKENFLMSKCSSYQNEILHTLNLLENCPELNKQLLKVTAPLSQYFISNDLIRISLNLEPTKIPSDHEARIIALAGILADIIPQDITFNNNPLLMKLSKFQAVADFIDIINLGKFYPAIDGKFKNIDLILDLDNEELQRSFSINSEGKVAAGEGYIWEAPGLISSCKQLKINEQGIKPILKKFISTIYQDNEITGDRLIEVSPEKIIFFLVKFHPSYQFLSINQINDLKNLALLAFNTQTALPLITLWKRSLEMMESEKETAKSKKILRSITLSLPEWWPKNLILRHPRQSKMIQQVFYRILQSKLLITYEYQTKFQNSCNTTKIAEFLESYIAHEVIRGERLTAIRKIRNPKNFHSYVLHSLKLTQEIIKDIQSHTSRKNYQNILSKIDNLLLKLKKDYKPFIESVFKNYVHDNKKLKAPLKQWKKLKHLPFRDATGISNLTLYLNTEIRKSIWNKSLELYRT